MMQVAQDAAPSRTISSSKQAITRFSASMGNICQPIERSDPWDSSQGNINEQSLDAPFLYPNGQERRRSSLAVNFHDIGTGSSNGAIASGSTSASRLVPMTRTSSLASVLSGAALNEANNSTSNLHQQHFLESAASGRRHSSKKRSPAEPELTVSITPPSVQSNSPTPDLFATNSASSLTFNSSPKLSHALSSSHLFNFYEDLSLQKYITERSFLPNTNLIPQQMPDCTVLRDIALLTIRIDHLSELVEHYVKLFENWTPPHPPRTTQKSPLSVNHDGDSSHHENPSSQLYKIVSQYVNRIIRVIVTEHGGIIESFDGEQIIAIFRPVEDEQNIVEESRGIHGSPHVHNIDHHSFETTTRRHSEPADLSTSVKETLLKRTESCRRATQCAYFLQQKAGSLRVDLPELVSDSQEASRSNSLSPQKNSSQPPLPPASNSSLDVSDPHDGDGSITLSLRCAVGVGVCTISTVGGEERSWSRLMKNDAFSQIAEVIHKEGQQSSSLFNLSQLQRSFSSGILNEDSIGAEFQSLIDSEVESTGTLSVIEEHNSGEDEHPGMTPSTPLSALQHHSFYASFRSRLKSFIQREEDLSGTCIVSEQVRILIHNSCSLQKLSLQDFNLNYYKVVGIKDWMPLPEEMKEEAATTHLVPVPEDTLCMYIPPLIREYIDMAYENFKLQATQSSNASTLKVGELDSSTDPASLRHAALIFFRYEYIDHSVKEDHLEQLQALQEVFCLIQKMVMHSGKDTGSIIGTKHNENGTTFVISFSQTSEEKSTQHQEKVPHSTAELRAVRAALRIQRLMQTIVNDFPVQLNIVVGSGTIFSGVIGDSRRRCYAYVGETVDRCEQLLQFVPNSVLCDASVYEATQDRVVYSRLGMDSHSKSAQSLLDEMKQESLSSPVYIARDTLPEAGLITPIDPKERVCFREETELMNNSLESFMRTNSYHSLSVVGAQGSGKTELIKRFLHLASLRNQSNLTPMRVCVLPCLKREKDTPYFLLRLLFLLHVTDLSDVSLGQRKYYIRTIMRTRDDNFKSYEPYLELLNPVFNVDFETSELSRDLSASNRTKKLYKMIHHFFLDRFLDGNLTIFVVEDYHYLDEESKSFLLHLHTLDVDNLFMLVTQNLSDDHGRQSTGYADENSVPCTVRDLVTMTSRMIRLQPLNREEVAELALYMWNCSAPSHGSTASHISPDLIDNLLEESQGSPFFVDQFVHLYDEWDCIAVGEAETKNTYPASTSTCLQFTQTDRLYELNVTADCFALRLQNLPDAQAELIRAAALICSFSYIVDSNFLSNFAPQTSKQEIQDMIYQLVQNNFLLEYNRSMRLFAFSSERLCEAIVNLIPTEQQQQLHMKIANLKESEWFSGQSHIALDEITFHLCQALQNDEEASVAQLNKAVQFIQKSVEHRKLTREFNRALEYQQLLIWFVNRLPQTDERDTLLSSVILQKARLESTLHKSPDTIRHNLRTAIEICPSSSSEELFNALDNLWIHEYQNASEREHTHGSESWWPLVTRLLKLAQSTKSPVQLVEAYRCAVVSLFFSNKFTKINEYLYQLLEVYQKDSLMVNSLLTAQLNRPNAAIQTCLLAARANWYLGRLKNAHIAYCSAREVFHQISHPASRAMFLNWSCYYLFLVRKISQLQKLSKDAIILSEKQDYTLQKYVAMCYHGYAVFFLGNRKEGFLELKKAIDTYLTYGSLPDHLLIMYVSVLIEHEEEGNLKEALENLNRAIENHKEHSKIKSSRQAPYNLDSELYRLKAQILWKQRNEASSGQDKKILKVLTRALEIERHKPKSLLPQVRLLLDMIRLCDENIHPGRGVSSPMADSPMSDKSSNSKTTSNWKNKKQKYIGMLRSIRKQIIGEHFPKSMKGYLNSYLELEEITAMHRVVLSKGKE